MAVNREAKRRVTPASEEYLETIYRLEERKGVARTSELTDLLGVVPGSVTNTIEELERRGLVIHEPYKGVKLTAEGRKIALKILRRHRLLERFLHDILKIGKDVVHGQACEMEHTLSGEVERGLCQFLNHPDKCPDDEKIIPPCDLQFTSCEECLKRHGKSTEEVGKREANLVSMHDLKERDIGKIAFIRGDRRILQRLMDLGLTPGTRISIVRAAPFKGPIKVEVRGSKLAIGQDIALNVFVELAKNNLEG